MRWSYFRHTSFHHQLTVVLTAGVLGLALFSSLMNSWEASRRMKEYLVEQGLRITENLARQSTLTLLYHSAENAKEAMATTLMFPDVLYVEITDGAHRFRVTKAKEGWIPPRQPVAMKHPISRIILEQETSEQWRFAAPVYGGQAEDSPFDVQERKPQLLGYVHVVLGKGTLDRLVLSLLLGNLAITFSFAVILLWVMHRLAQRMTHPLNVLSSLMGRAEAGELRMRAIPEGPKDLIEMATAFNTMMDVLEAREEELKRSRDDAVRLALIKTQFASTVSHEVRTPLNGVIGMLELLKEMELAKNQQEYVEVAWRSAHSLLQLINDILDFSKMEAGKLILEETNFDFRELIEEVIELFSKQAQQKGLELGYLMDANVPEGLKCDAMRLRQVLTNLMGNALKFTENGEVAMFISCIEGGGEYFDLRVEVRDTGIGIKEESAQHIFESFAQADKSTTRKYGGTGLGLAICKQLVELMNGEIGVRPAQGERGTVFWFTIRCRASDRNVLLSAPPRDPTLSGVRVLIVEESRVIRNFLEHSLTSYGMSCQAVHNGFEALAELSQAHHDGAAYHLVIMDSNVTAQENLHLATCIRADSRLKARILILNRDVLPARRLSLMGDGYLGKPLRLKRLLEVIKYLLLDKQDNYEEKLAALVSQPQPQPQPEARETPSPEKKYCVLVTDDNAVNRMVAAGMLAKHNCHCEFANNGFEAIEAVKKTRFDLILMDCNMPDMDGYEATIHIRRFEETIGRRTPIVALTANVQEGDAEKCLAVGMDDYLPKPLTLNILRPKLEHWLPLEA